MLLLVHISSFSYCDRCESKVIGIFNNHNELANILEQFRQNDMDLNSGEYDDYECEMVQVTMSHAALFNDYHTDKWVVYEINPLNGTCFHFEGLEPYQIYVIKYPYEIY